MGYQARRGVPVFYSTKSGCSMNRRRRRSLWQRQAGTHRLQALSEPTRFILREAVNQATDPPREAEQTCVESGENCDGHALEQHPDLLARALHG